MPWSQSRTGRVLDLLNPTPAQVDFREIADTLADINRYAGAAPACPVSVAFHTLIACEAAPEWARPWVLLHDAHEWAFGDLISPLVEALDDIAVEKVPALSRFIPDCVEELKRRHDVAIHQAAGLDLPGPAIKAAIREADLVALVTERRFFLAPPPKPWHPAIERAAPLPRRPKWQPPDRTADALFALFRHYLPALQRAA